MRLLSRMMLNKTIERIPSRFVFFHMKNKVLLFAGLFGFLFFFPDKLDAQKGVGVLTANNDNFFVTPGQPATLDVLKNDDPGDCNTLSLTLSISIPPTNGMAMVAPTVNRILYVPTAGFIGQDVLQYQITCNGETKTAMAHINVFDKPDNVYTDVCYVPIPAIGWDIKELDRSKTIVTNYSVPLCGDIDNDGNTEILIKMGEAGIGDYGPVDRIYIFTVDKTTDKVVLKDSITTVPTSTAAPILIANVDGDKYTSVFVTSDARASIGADKQLLLKYSYNPLTGKYQEAWRRQYSTDPAYPGGLPVIADFAGDGNTQIVVYDKVYNAKNGTLLVDGGYMGNSYYSFGKSGHTPIYTGTVRATSASMVAADIDGDGLPEIIGGDCVYKVKITNHSGTGGNSFTFLRKANATGRPDVGDGAVAIADMDLDGLLDVVITHKMPLTGGPTGTGSLFIYNPRTGAIMNNTVINDIPIRPNDAPNNMVGPSVPFIGDVNNDGKPEIALVGQYVMNAYAFNATTGTISLLWSRLTTDESASTTMSLFDFTQSGDAQLVYRDQDSLRILNGATGITLAGYPLSASSTVDEYPIVADVNGDGAAEIIVSASNVASGTGELRVYASAGVPWAPARKVWNQFSYNPVYVNDDLTIPSYPLNPSTIFCKSDGIGYNRPFNNFLQQGTSLNEEGDMLYFGPDLTFSGQRPVIFYNELTDKLEITMTIGNVGNAVFPSPITVSIYVYNSTSGTFYEVDSGDKNITLNIGETTTFIYEIDNYMASVEPTLPPYEYWMIFLNSKNNAGSSPVYPATTENECLYWNNYTSNVSFTYGDRVICGGTTEAVLLKPSNVYDYEWYTQAVGGTPIEYGDSHVMTKNFDPVEYFYIDVYTKSGTRVTTIRDTVRIYLAPDSLIWTGGAGSSNWHDYNNWFNPNASVPDLYPQANIPRRCTDVLIPDYLSIYPDLSPTLTGTKYDDYANSECANITFSHGGEVMHTDSLHYDSAYVHLTLDANRWYTLSPPLKSMFPGDYYVNDPNPHLDDVFVYTSLYSQANPATGEYRQNDWTGSFHNPEVSMPTGFGMSVWVDNHLPLASVTSHDFTFPKYDKSYDIFGWGGNWSYNVPINRSDEHRFIYEDIIASDGSIALSTPKPTSGNYVLVGNPFMAHIDFNIFYTANSGCIDNFYQVLDKNNNWITYTVNGISTGVPPLNQYIAPMQSFLVRSKVNSGFQLVADSKMTANRPGEKLRNGGADYLPQLLTIEITRGEEQSNKTIVLYDPAENDFETGVPKFFMKEGAGDAVPAAVYTITSEGLYMDINKVENIENVIPIGIRTNEPGKLRLNFSGLSVFAPGYDLYLNDKELSTSHNLREGSFYEFEKTNTNLYDNRFTLSAVRSGTAVEKVYSNNAEIESYVHGGMLYVTTTDNSLLQEISLYDLQGRLIRSIKNIAGSTYELNIQVNSVYIVKAISRTAGRTMKIYGR